ncbi:glycosyltransferase [Pseudoroseicyclus sp. CXY001]|uniref:glycosyltransferase n=1 Tax=Pseudoroseicyclus sp. CXY001 TaxID=3242492 RepID=UPI0035711BFC
MSSALARLAGGGAPRGISPAIMSPDDAALIAASDLFDAKWYAARYPDIARLGLTPLEHYLQIGGRVGRDPGPNFDGAHYLKLYYDVRQAGMNALVHYLRFGAAEGRLPRPTDRGPSQLPAADPDAEVELSGALDLNADSPVLQGWLAARGEPGSRRVRVLIDGEGGSYPADIFRADVRARGYGTGHHGFRLTLGAQYLRGQTHNVELYDEESGRLVERRSFAWSRPKQRFRSFDDFLQRSMTESLVNAPFEEPQRRVFSQMDRLADRFAAAALALPERPRISVVMPVYNRAGIVGDAIASVLAQTWPELELVVVNDGSRDTSLEVVRAVDDPRVKIIDLGQNQGHSAARNAGGRAATGEFVAYLDSDNTWDPRYLAAMLGALMEGGADAVYSGFWIWRGDETAPTTMRYGHYHRGALENRNFADLNCFMLRRTLLEKIGGFATELRRFVDHDLVLRAGEEGRMISAPLTLVHYTIGRTDNAVSEDPALTPFRRKVQDRLATRRAAALARAPVALDRPVSAVIPNWRALPDLRDCLAAMEELRVRGDLEVVVVDNDSGPDTREFLRARAAEGRLRLMENEANYGFTYAVNQGARLARPGRDLMILNNDAILARNALRELQRAADTLPDAAITVPRQLLPPYQETIRAHMPEADRTVACDVTLSAHHDNIVDVPMLHDGGPVELRYAPFFAIYLRRDVWNLTGPLDAEQGRHYRSDWLYCDLIRRVHGKRIWYVPAASAVHKVQAATEELRRTRGGGGASFDMMFRKNRWDEATAADLGYRRPVWDLGD